MPKLMRLCLVPFALGSAASVVDQLAEHPKPRGLVTMLCHTACFAAACVVAMTDIGHCTLAGLLGLCAGGIVWEVALGMPGFACFGGAS
jgi:hypothetical protein